MKTPPSTTDRRCVAARKSITATNFAGARLGCPQPRRLIAHAFSSSGEIKLLNERSLYSISWYRGLKPGIVWTSEGRSLQRIKCSQL